MSGRAKGIIAIVASAMGFAMMAACVRLCDDYGAAVSCFEKSFFRNLIAFVIAGVAFLKTGWSWQLKASDWGLLMARSIFGSVGIFANFYALSKIPIADGQTLNKTAPFFTIVFAWMFLKERVSWRQFVAVAMAFVGAVLVAKPGFALDNQFALAMGLLGGVGAGAAYVAVHALGRRQVHASLIVFVFSAFSCLVAIPFTIADFVPLTWLQVLILCGAGAGAAIGQFGITLAYRFAAPREIAVYDYSNIVFTALLGYLLFGQVSDMLAFLGIAIIVLAAISLNFWYNTSKTEAKDEK